MAVNPTNVVSKASLPTGQFGIQTQFDTTDEVIKALEEKADASKTKTTKVKKSWCNIKRTDLFDKSGNPIGCITKGSTFMYKNNTSVSVFNPNGTCTSFYDYDSDGSIDRVGTWSTEGKFTTIFKK